VFTGPQVEVSDLEIPDWLPQGARFAASRIYQRELSDGTSEDISLLKRLMSDERMKKVWRELNKGTKSKSNSVNKFVSPHDYYLLCLAQSKRKKSSELRNNGGDFNEATAKLLESEAGCLDKGLNRAIGSWPEQACAVYCFFWGAFHIARDLQPQQSREGMTLILDEWSDAERQLERLSKKLRFFGMDQDAEELLRITSTVSERASFIEIDYEDSGMRIIDRLRSNPLMQKYLVQLSKINRVIFESPLFGTLAATANVALDPIKAVDHKQVREVLRSFPDTGMGGYDPFPWD
jgi:hypothetical protein